MISTTSLKTRIGILAATVATMAAVAAPAQASFGPVSFLVSAVLTQNQGVDSASAVALAIPPATPATVGPMIVGFCQELTKGHHDGREGQSDRPRGG